MARWVLNKLTGMVHDVPEGHWSLTSADYEEVGPKTSRPPEPSEEPSGTLLPEDFPHRDVLASFGYDTYESLEGAPKGRLASLKGLGPVRAEAIVTALER
jgi:hypothetical protein